MNNSGIYEATLPNELELPTEWSGPQTLHAINLIYIPYHHFQKLQKNVFTLYKNVFRAAWSHYYLAETIPGLHSPQPSFRNTDI